MPHFSEFNLLSHFSPSTSTIRVQKYNEPSYCVAPSGELEEGKKEPDKIDFLLFCKHSGTGKHSSTSGHCFSVIQVQRET